MTKTRLPILYSFRRCPYAIRARLAIALANIQVEIREVTLKNKPKELLAISPKATVPVLQTTDGKIIDESFDIMLWALRQNDPEHLLRRYNHSDASKLENYLRQNGKFKLTLDRYKYHDRYPEYTQEEHRKNTFGFLHYLEGLLDRRLFLNDNNPTFADILVMPFIRQYANIDKTWFVQSQFVNVRNWLTHWLDSEIFRSIMSKYPAWQPSQDSVVFPAN